MRKLWRGVMYCWMYVVYGIGEAASWIICRVPDVEEDDWRFKIFTAVYKTYSYFMIKSCDINDKYGFHLWVPYDPEGEDREDDTN